jgi:hypothetical protein
MKSEPMTSEPKKSESSKASAVDLAPVVRASDAEREAAASSIADALAEGRLSIDEGRQRIEAIYQSRHRHQLDEVVADLPALSNSGRLPFARTSRRLPVLVVIALLTVTALLVQVLAGLWEVWPVGMAAVGLLALRPR